MAAAVASVSAAARRIAANASLVLFTALTVAGFAGHAGTDRWLATWAGAGVGLVIYLLKFSKSYPERVTHTEASAPATS